MTQASRQPTTRTMFQWYTRPGVDVWHAVLLTASGNLAYRTMCGALQLQHDDETSLHKAVPDETLCPGCVLRYLQLGSPQCWDAGCNHYFTSHALEGRAKCLALGCKCTRYRSTAELERALIHSLASRVAERSVEPNDRAAQVLATQPPLAQVVLVQLHGLYKLMHRECVGHGSTGGMAVRLGAVMTDEGTLAGATCPGCQQYLVPGSAAAAAMLATNDTTERKALMGAYMDTESGYDGPPWPAPHIYVPDHVNPHFEQCYECKAQRGTPWHT